MENKKNNKGLIAIIIILTLCILGLVGYIIYDKALIKENNEKKTLSTKSTTITTTIKKEENLEKIAQNLEKKLLTDDGTSGLYYDYININDVNNAKFIVFNIKQYILENKINYSASMDGCGVEINETNGYVISKDIINKYIQKKYNTTNNYDILESKYIPFSTGGTEHVVSNGDNYIIGCLAQSGGISKIFNKYQKIEQEKDRIYLYDNAISCHAEMQDHYCTKEVDTNLYENVIFDANNSNTNIDTFEDMANHIFSNLLDKTNTYKHTFIKSEDGSYYWHSTEIVK